MAHLLPPKLVQISFMSQNGVIRAAWLACLRPAHCSAQRQEPCLLHHGQIAGCPLRCSDLGSLARYLSLFPQLHPNETHPTLPGGLRHALIPAKVAICCRRVLGCHPHPSCMGKALGFGVALFKACSCGRGLCLNRRYGVGPACDSLDHRAGVCYLPCSLPYNELCHAIGLSSLSVPPFAF